MRAAQLDRLTGLLGMDTVELGVISFTAAVKIVPANGFWVLDDRLVVAEDRHAELWLDDTDNVTLYRKVWQTLSESAVYGADAHNVINAARRSLNPRWRGALRALSRRLPLRGMARDRASGRAGREGSRS